MTNPESKDRSRPGTGLLAVLRHRNYRLYFTGQLVSLLGFWMQAVAQGWLVYHLTGSSLQLGIVGFAGQIPMLLVSPLAGVVADRVDRRLILFVTQGTMMASAALLALLTLSGLVHVWHIAACALVSGLANAFDVPTRQSLTIQLVGRADLPSAIALNSIMFNLTRFVGPGIAGLLVAAIGEGWCIGLNAISYVAALTALALIRLEAVAPREPSHPLADLREGFTYVWGHPQMRNLLMLLGTTTLCGACYLVLMPVFARDVLRGGSDALGYLMSAVGAGALCGALAITRLKPVLLPVAPYVAAGIFGLSLAAFSQSQSFPLSLLLLVCAGFGMMAQGVATNTMIQAEVSDSMRGRVMAYYVMSFIGLAPVSSLLAGWVSHGAGAPATLAAGGIMVASAALVAALRRHGRLKAMG